MTFLGHSINFSKRSDSKDYMENLSSFLRKKAFMGLAKAQRVTSLTIFGQNIVVNSLISTYFEYYGSPYTLGKKDISPSQTEIDLYIKGGKCMAAGTGRYGSLKDRRGGATSISNILSTSK